MLRVLFFFLVILVLQASYISPKLPRSSIKPSRRINFPKTIRIHHPHIGINMYRNKQGSRDCSCYKDQRKIEVRDNTRTDTSPRRSYERNYYNPQKTYQRKNNIGKIFWIGEQNKKIPHKTRDKKSHGYRNKNFKPIGNIGGMEESQKLIVNRHGIISNIGNGYGQYSNNFQDRNQRQILKQLRPKDQIKYIQNQRTQNINNDVDKKVVQWQQMAKNAILRHRNRGQKIVAEKKQSQPKLYLKPWQNLRNQGQLSRQRQEEVVQLSRNNVNQIRTEAQPSRENTIQNVEVIDTSSTNEGQPIEQLQEEAAQRHRNNVLEVLSQQAANEQTVIENPEQNWQSQQRIYQQQSKPCKKHNNWTNNLSRRFNRLQNSMLSNHQRRIQQSLQALHSSMIPTRKSCKKHQKLFNSHKPFNYKVYRDNCNFNPIKKHFFRQSRQ